MRSCELAETALSMRNDTFKADDLWTTFEVIENGELGMQDFVISLLIKITRIVEFKLHHIKGA